MARTVNPREHAARRQAIVDVAKACFARKGFHQASTAEICAAAGISPGALFHYFPSKKAIIAAIVEQEGAETAAYFDAAEDGDDLYAEVMGFLDLALELAADGDFASLTLEIAAEATRDPDIGRLAARNDAELRARLEGLLDGAARRGQIDPGLPASEAASCLTMLVDGAFSRVATDPDFRPAEQKGAALLLARRFLRPTHGEQQ